MAVDGSRIEAAAAPLLREISTDHDGHPGASIRTVGILVAVEYEDPDTGDRRTRTHYRFVEAPEFENCAAYVALGLANQVAQHLA